MHTLRLSVAGVVVLSLAGALTSAVVAQERDDEAVEPGSILFVGNSFTDAGGGVENHVAALVESEDPPRDITADASTMGGATLKIHHQMSEPDSVFGAVAAIRSGEHDVVVLQDDIPEYVEHEVAPFLEYARLFDQEIRDVGAETVFFMTWPYERLDWVSLDEIVAAHRQVEAELGAKVAPVGVAMANALAERPDLAMLGPDAEHESLAGTYLAAAVIYATLFDRSPEGLLFHHALSEDEATFLQRVAWETVEAWRQGEPSGSAVEDSGDDRAAIELPDLPAFVTGTESCGRPTSGETVEADGIQSYRDFVAECGDYMSDPRVDGTWTNTRNMDCHASGMCLVWGSHVLDGPDGGWDCSWAGAYYPNLGDGFMVSGVCPGTDGFDGLTYVFQHGNAGFEGGSPFGDDSTFDGVIYEGPAPMVFALQSEANE